MMNKKNIAFFILHISLSTTLFSQKINPADLKKLALFEDTLKEYSQYIQTDSLTEDRMVSDSIFIRTLVRALKVPNSFYYPFQDVKGISKLYAPDSSFRIITWNIQFDDYYSRQRGAIQKKTTDGKLSLFPLRDCSEFTAHATDSVRNKNNWIGAVYYNIIKTEYQGIAYYTLFGLDLYSAMSNKKWIDVLNFDRTTGEPVFGAAVFSFENDTIPTAPLHRYKIEFKKSIRVTVDYIKDLNMILVDHLISETNEPNNKWTYVPDGDNEGFVWKTGKWVHIDKVFNAKLKDGEAPREVPLFDAEGTNTAPKRKPKK